MFMNSRINYLRLRVLTQSNNVVPVYLLCHHLTLTLCYTCILHPPLFAL